jgi:hypothetical protein
MSDAPPLIVMPGQMPPDLTPYCQICDMPVERLWITPFTEAHQDHIIVNAACCNQQSASRVSLRAIWALKASGQKWFAIVKRGLRQGPRDLKKTDFRGLHG